MKNFSNTNSNLNKQIFRSMIRTIDTGKVTTTLKIKKYF